MLIAHAAATRESKPKGERIGASLCKTYMPTVVNSTTIAGIAWG